MSDAFVPEADRLDQEREVVPHDDADSSSAVPAGLRVPTEASEADVLEQAQDVDGDDDYE